VFCSIDSAATAAELVLAAEEATGTNYLPWNSCWTVQQHHHHLLSLCDQNYSAHSSSPGFICRPLPRFEAIACRRKMACGKITNSDKERYALNERNNIASHPIEQNQQPSSGYFRQQY
jgi:hypothetical protein